MFDLQNIHLKFQLLQSHQNVRMSDPVLGHFSIKEIMQLRPIPIWFLVHRILSKKNWREQGFFFLRTKIIEAKGFC